MCLNVTFKSKPIYNYQKPNPAPFAVRTQAKSTNAFNKNMIAVYL